jgi:hypothetical protein
MWTYVDTKLVYADKCSTWNIKIILRLAKLELNDLLF